MKKFILIIALSMVVGCSTIVGPQQIAGMQKSVGDRNGIVNNTIFDSWKLLSDTTITLQIFSDSSYQYFQYFSRGGVDIVLSKGIFEINDSILISNNGCSAKYTIHNDTLIMDELTREAHHIMVRL